MTYHQKPTVLIARSGYGSPQPSLPAMAGLGSGDYMVTPGARLYVGPHGQLDESLGGIWDSVASFVKGAGKSAVDFYGQSQQNKGAADALKVQQAGRGGGMPSWVLPVALVGGGVVLVMLLRKPRKNPSYRSHIKRRRRHRRHLVGR